MNRIAPPTLRRPGNAAISIPDTQPVVIACPHSAANDTTESKSDSHDLVHLVDALADYTADLLTRGQLGDLLTEADLKGSSDRKCAFTRTGPPSIK
jgi:hypothetical protein